MSADKPAVWTPARSAAGLHNPWLITVILSLATFMEVLDTSVANISLAHIGGDLSVSYDEATWILTSYLVANAVIVPLSGWLSQAIGRKRYYMLSVALFTLSSLACAAAPTLGWLILARILQGIGGGGLAPCEQSMLIDTFAPERRGRAISAYGVVLIVGPALGPTLGGLITDHASWRWIFLINIPVGLISLLLVSRFVAEPAALKVERAERLRGGLRLDTIGFALTVLGLGCLQFVIDRGQHEDWFASRLIWTLAVAAAASLVGLVLWERQRADPVLDFRLFKDRAFAAASILMLVTGAVLYATTQIVPQFLQQVMGYTAGWAGLAMTASSLATLAMTGVAAALSNRVPGWLMIAVGLVIESWGLAHMTHINQTLGFWTFAADRVWIVAGLPLILVPLTTGAYANLPASATGQASAFLNLFRNVGGAAGISAVQTILAQRTPAHAARLQEGLALAEPKWRTAASLVSASMERLYAGDVMSAMRATAALVGELDRQAQVLAYIDAFWILAVLVAAVTPLVLLMRLRAPTSGR